MSEQAVSYRQLPEQVRVVNSFLVEHVEDVWRAHNAIVDQSPTGLVELDSTSPNFTRATQGGFDTPHAAIMGIARSFETAMIASLFQIYTYNPPSGDAISILEEEHERGGYGSSLLQILLDGSTDEQMPFIHSQFTAISPVATYMARVVGTPARVFVPIPEVIRAKAQEVGTVLTPTQLLESTGGHLDHFHMLYRLPIDAAKRLVHPTKGILLKDRMLDPDAFVVRNGDADNFQIDVNPIHMSEATKGHICPFACGNDTEQQVKLPQSLNMHLLRLWQEHYIPTLDTNHLA
ncbi:hypothetical protein KC909_05015 [Candidatus Dojkabacteria bacterium]|uniref:Uncharacterized protein n=1 Tax=Candidatus Dojkabacteria bacterium TaxID=2099670 RepID=A0A955L628_9BACT|nr:hypothetical protein [Candidatus Dojkabacteria bacterium]